MSPKRLLGVCLLLLTYVDRKVGCEASTGKGPTRSSLGLGWGVMDPPNLVEKPLNFIAKRTTAGHRGVKDASLNTRWQ